MLEEAKKRAQEELEKSEPRKKRKWVRKKSLRNPDAESLTPLEAAKGALEDQGLTKKINYDQLEKLFDVHEGDNANVGDGSVECGETSRKGREQVRSDIPSFRCKLVIQVHDPLRDVFVTPGRSC